MNYWVLLDKETGEIVLIERHQPILLQKARDSYGRSWAADYEYKRAEVHVL